MREGTPSTTAMIVAYARAVASNDSELARACQDPIAERVVPWPYRNLLAFARSARQPAWHYRNLRIGSLGLVDHLALRTALIDRGLREAMQAGVRQVVLLGAGLDARVHRVRELRDATLFEVDHPSTQALKLRKAAGLPVLAKELRYAPCDFEEVTLDQALLGQGFLPSEPSVWIWEGVTMYLEGAAIEGSLAKIAALSAPGSSLIATYVTPRLTVSQHPSLQLGLWFMALLSEPVRSPMAPHEMAERLARHGFEVTYDALPADIAAEFGVERALRMWGMPDEHTVIARKR